MEVTVQQESNYQIHIGTRDGVSFLQDELQHTSYFVCLDQRVKALHGDYLAPLLAHAKGVYLLEATEENKEMTTVSEIHTMLHEAEATRSDVLVAIGGGITGDVAGFAASLYLRGMQFIQVPTTLLAQVDSSIGSKVGVNAYGIKNVLGAFHAPKQVVLDLAFLDTLTERLFKEGLVELLKHGFIQDATILTDLSTVPDIADLRSKPYILEQLIRKSLAVKKKVVQADPLDTGWRHVLNFGHTFAHALELSTTSHLYHGECVAVGMLVACAMTPTGAADFDALAYRTWHELCVKFSLLRPFEAVDFSKIRFDKKRTAEQVKEVVLQSIGQPEIVSFALADLTHHLTTIYQAICADETLITQAPAFVFRPVKLRGTVHVPPSKSYAHRYIIAAALAGKETVLQGMSEIADDVAVTMAAVEALGAHATWQQATGEITVRPAPPSIKQAITVEMGESGTSYRLLLPLLLDNERTVTITGKGKLPTRPMATYMRLFAQHDVRVNCPTSETFLPMELTGCLKAGSYTVEGNVSSQFISGLLFALPRLMGTSEITVTSPLESLPYVQMTLAVLRDFGIKISHDEQYQHFVIDGRQQYHSRGVYTVEQDYSARGFWEVAQGLGHQLTIVPESGTTLQGDSIVGQIVQSQAKVVNLMDVPDTAPILASYFTIVGGKMAHTERLKYKESDRLAAIMAYLHQNQITYHQEQDELEITAGHFMGGACDTYHDHRIMMALIIASTVAKGAITLTEISSCRKSYPNFIEHYEQLGGFVDEK